MQLSGNRITRGWLRACIVHSPEVWNSLRRQEIAPMNEGFIFLAGAEIAENPKSVDLPLTQQTLSGTVCIWNKHFSSSLYFYQQPRKFHLSLRRRRNHLLPLKNYGHRGYEFVSVFLWSKKYNAEVTNSHSAEPPFWQLEEKYMRTNTGWRNAITACHIWTNARLKDAWKRDKKRK